MLTLVKKVSPGNLVIVTGLGRSGKWMLTPIIASLENSDILQTDYILEQYPWLHGIGAISDDVAVYLLRYSFNLLVYNNYIGRNTNFRHTDITSIWGAPNPGDYFKRIFSEEGDNIFEQVMQGEKLSVFLFHNALWHADILFKAVPNLKMLNIKRHPIDVVYSWHSKGYGSTAYYEKPRNALLAYHWKDSILPYYAFGWEEEFVKLPETDRIIRMIDHIQNKHHKTHDKLSPVHSNNVMIVYFEKMVTSPHLELESICRFLGASKSLHTNLVLEKQRCPRVLKAEERNKKLDILSRLASPDSIDLLEQMAKDYDMEVSQDI